MAFICLVLLVNGFPSLPFYLQGLSSFRQLGQTNFLFPSRWKPIIPILHLLSLSRLFRGSSSSSSSSSTSSSSSSSSSSSFYFFMIIFFSFFRDWLFVGQKEKLGCCFQLLLFGFYCGFCKTLFQLEDKNERKKTTAPTTLLFCAFVKKKKDVHLLHHYHSYIVAFQSIKTSSAQILSVSGCTLTQRKELAGHLFHPIPHLFFLFPLIPSGYPPGIMREKVKSNKICQFWCCVNTLGYGH